MKPVLVRKSTLITLLSVLAGVFVGAGLYFLYTIMAPYYSIWMHSSHGRDATCNDCHVAKFISSSERDVIRAEEPSSRVIMNNCILCHEQLTNEFVKDGKMDFMKTTPAALASVFNNKKVEITGIEPHNDVFGQNYPREYETWKQTEICDFKNQNWVWLQLDISPVIFKTRW